MTDITTPSEKGATINNSRMAQSISKAGGHDGYVVGGVDISPFYSELDTTGVNSFARSSVSGLEVTIDGGEAFLYGWLCRDRPTTLTLPSNSSGTIYVGYNGDAVLPTDTSPDENDNIIMGTADAFGNNDPKLPLYDFTTSTSSITDWNSVRNIGRHNADAPWLGKGGGTATGEITVESSGEYNHLRTIRPGVGDWSIGPTTAHNESFQLEESNTGTEFYFTKNGEFVANGDHAVKSPNGRMIYVQSSEPSGASNGDIWIETD